MKGQTNAKLASKGVQGESVNIALLTNQKSRTDLIGAVITVSYGGVDTEYVWEGNDITVQIPSSTDYGISVSYVEGYATPEGFSATSQNGYSRRVEMIYRCELVTINVVSESDIDGYEIYINKLTHVSTGYTELEYIESNGNQYIDTGIIPEYDKIRVVVDFLYTATPSSKVVFGCQHNTETSRYGLICYNSPASIYVGSSAALLPKTISLNTRYVLDVKADEGTLNVYWNGSRTNTIYSGTIYKGYSFYLFGNNRENSVDQMSSIKMYSCQIYDCDILVRDYIPVKRNSDNVCGLLDKIENKFYPSKSSSNFIPGNIVKEIMGEQRELLYTQTTSIATYYLPYGMEYLIEASKVNGYGIPTIQKKVANKSKRNIEIKYMLIPIGVFIQGTSGNFYEIDSFDNQEPPNGVAINTGNRSFIIALERTSSGVMYEDVYYDPSIPKYSDVTSALTDFDGYNNTRIISELPGGGACREAIHYVLPNGKKGAYIPALGELNIIINNKNAIIRALEKLNITNFFNYYIPSSTRSSNDPDYTYWSRLWTYNYTNKEFEAIRPTLTGSIMISPI